MEEARCEVCKKRAAEEEEAKRKADAEARASESQKKTTEQFDREKQDLRARLLAHFNRVLPTTDTPRGLVIDMDDVLFDNNKSDLRPEAREDLAKLSGIVLNYPSLRLAIEGHTDNTGNPEMNQTLSEQRANAVRNYLINQGLDTGSLSAQGLGMNNPSSGQCYSRRPSEEPPDRNHRLRGGYRNSDRILEPEQPHVSGVKLDNCSSFALRDSRLIPVLLDTPINGDDCSYVLNPMLITVEHESSQR